ncbi:MAG TPA: hypothetical protein VNB24_04900 [Acidimicrobiales bacterium]|nr:hypothetical protein [Acidimicrobiales bacterium]
MASVVVLPSRSSSDAARKFVPLVLLLVGLLIALAVLPSALNLPQSNPATTLEYAPVPPTDEDVPPPVGNFSSFGLGNSSSLDAGGAPGGDGEGFLTDPPPPSDPAGRGKTPSTKRCVQTPRGPKQTEDPLAPPCVADFDCKENGGATYQGVTAKEIRILVYYDTGITDVRTSRGDEPRPTNKLYDLDKPEEPDEHLYARLMRGWARYFEDRYQLYCRHAHFYVYYGSEFGSPPENKRADAADNYATVKPFAVLSNAFANNDAYLEAMAKRGVLNFGSFAGREAEFFKRYAKLIWGYPPPIETVADHYVTAFCRQIKPYPATFAGGNLKGKPRKYGLVYPSDEKHPELVKLKDEVMAGIKAKCPIVQEGGIPEGTWAACCYAENNTATPTYASDAMAKFSNPNQAGGPVTTIIWPGGMESKFSDQAFARQYLPEWILTGDGEMDGWFGTQYQNQQVFSEHAVIITNQVRVGHYDTEPCFLAYRDADPQAPAVDVSIRACEIYERLRQMFIGIQVAGPKLGPTSIDKGFHAIPKIASENPGVPACFYNINDYTCVKDAAAMWWDANGQAPNSADPGCWKMFRQGKRYLLDQWPQQELWSMRSPDDPCNNWSVRVLRSAAP